MKRAILISFLMVALLSFSAAALADGPRGSEGWNYCPYCGSNLGEPDDYMGPGMMQRGWGYGPGMMQRGWERGPGPGMTQRGWDRGHGPGMMYRDWDRGPGRMYQGWGYDPERRAECQKFLDETKELRKQFNDKRFEYAEALRNPDTTGEALSKLQKEMADLQAKLYDKAPRGCR